MEQCDGQHVNSKTVEVVALILMRGDKVLLARRPPGDRLAGRWEFPGGKVESDENPEGALEREIEEEMQFRVKALSKVISVNWREENKTINLHAWLGEEVAGEPTAIFHDQIKWVNINDILNYPMPPADVSVAQAILRNYSMPEKEYNG